MVFRFGVNNWGKTLMVGSNIASLLSIAETIETIERK
ncbi:Uncharacterised protein [Streptococcus pneumoniae]|nr:Uncharacterised protein [Streptococcus pneumoniae]VNF23763.1 Uncharacterised protein [Streptococcus pneumoniae]VQM21483.1 Uncharacterised protein [Streptococcus pneumoniae]VTJ09661.1 Uncharacterised protein [Streptococcus pneumoniae]